MGGAADGGAADGGAVDLLAAFLPRRDVGGAAASPAMPALADAPQLAAPPPLADAVAAVHVSCLLADAAPAAGLTPMLAGRPS